MLSFYLEWLKIVFNNNAKRVHKLIELFETDFHKQNGHYSCLILLLFQAFKTLKLAYFEAKFFEIDIIGTEHLLLSILKDEDNVASKILNQYGITYTIWRHSSGAIGRKFLGYNFLFAVNVLINIIQVFSRKQHKV